MAIISLNEETTGLDYDRRFKQWGKVIRSSEHIDLGKTRGYSITGPWVKWGQSISLKEGQFLIAAAQSGSRNHHSYEYLFLTVKDDKVIEVQNSEEFEQACKTLQGVTETQVAAAQNSELYSFALRAAWEMSKPKKEEEKKSKLEAEKAQLLARLAEIEKELKKLSKETPVSSSSSLENVRKQFEKNETEKNPSEFSF